MMKRISFFLIALVALAACQDDDAFTTSKGALLTFDGDTLKMDTEIGRAHV